MSTGAPGACLRALVRGQQLDQAADLRLSLPGGLGDRLERLGHAGPIGVAHPLPGAGLHDHHAEAVGDGVVQLACYPGPLVAKRFHGEQLLLS
jgi:hypothetical protein